MRDLSPEMGAPRARRSGPALERRRPVCDRWLEEVGDLVRRVPDVCISAVPGEQPAGWPRTAVALKTDGLVNTAVRR